MDLDLHPQSPFTLPDDTEVPAADLQNLTADQSAQIIENTDGIQEYQDFGKVETVENYDDPDLKLETCDQLETGIYQKAFADLDDQTTDSLAAISKNISTASESFQLVPYCSCCLYAKFYYSEIT